MSSQNRLLVTTNQRLKEWHFPCFPYDTPTQVFYGDSILMMAIDKGESFMINDPTAQQMKALYDIEMSQEKESLKAAAEALRFVQNEETLTILQSILMRLQHLMADEFWEYKREKLDY